ncbi:hypothetical protein Fcan01_11847 [Folsomia candida]|uniref:Uncharacterized protein n=1 Tax=Folsomia candida TaxID=158441 RepID=A0A226E952_FOLCA|nr:hypothetical protein Fcan01_11847 [Folsomia candida]
MGNTMQIMRLVTFFENNIPGNGWRSYAIVFSALRAVVLSYLASVQLELFETLNRDSDNFVECVASFVKLTILESWGPTARNGIATCLNLSGNRHIDREMALVFTLYNKAMMWIPTADESWLTFFTQNIPQFGNESYFPMATLIERELVKCKKFVYMDTDINVKEEQRYLRKYYDWITFFGVTSILKLHIGETRIN